MYFSHDTCQLMHGPDALHDSVQDGAGAPKTEYADRGGRQREVTSAQPYQAFEN